MTPEVKRVIATVASHRAKLAAIEADPPKSKRELRRLRSFHIDHIEMHLRWLSWRVTA